MFKKIKALLFGRDLIDAINETKKIRVCGIKFEITKLSVLDHIQSNKTLLKAYGEWNEKKGDENIKITDSYMKKLKAHYSDCFLQSVVAPKISRKAEDGGIWVEHLFTDWDLAEELYNQIMIYTYGKKKVKLFISQGKKLLKSTTSLDDMENFPPMS